MDVTLDAEVRSARIAQAIGSPVRGRMLYALLDGRAYPSTELALLAGVGPPSASAHLKRLTRERLVEVLVQGRHRYYRLRDPGVATVLEDLLALSGGSSPSPKGRTPHELRFARACYDHLAGTLGVLMHDRMLALEWLAASGKEYELTAKGAGELTALSIDVGDVRRARRRFAFPCLDWSERQFHLGGALGAALLRHALKRRWLRRGPAQRALAVTTVGARELRQRFGLILG